MIDIASHFLQVVAVVVTTLYGYRRVETKLDGKVDVLVYQAKVTELHNTINRERELRAALEAEVRMLKQLAHSHAA